MYIYAQLDTDGYCIAISQLSGEVVQPNLVKLNSFDASYIKRKYNTETEQWTDEYMPEPELADPVNEAIDTYTLNLVQNDLLK